MRKLTQKDWKILESFKGPIIDTELIFEELNLRVNFEEMKDLLMSMKESDHPANRFHTLLLRLPHSMTYEELEELYRFFLLKDFHHDHEYMVGAFQRFFNKNPKNIEVILKIMSDLPAFYRHDGDIRDPFIRKCMYAIAAQPEPNNIETLVQLTRSKDESIHTYAQYQLEKIAKNKEG